MIDRANDAPVGAGLDGFEFVDGGRTFTCSVEAPRAARPEGWWWFQVTPDAREQRYAPFRAAADDTRDDVRARIVAYYDALLARRAEPATSNHWGHRRPNAPNAVGAPSYAAQPDPAQSETAGGPSGDTTVV